MSSKSSRKVVSSLRRNIFELQKLELRQLLATASVDVNHILQVLGTSGNDTITINKNGSGRLTVTGVATTFAIGSGAGQANAINIQASGGNDTILISSNVRNASNVGIPATIAGNAGNDNITGGPGNDVLSGNDGNDTLDGGVGNDLMTGGANTDTTNYSNRTGALRITLDNAANDGEVAIAEADNVQTEEVIGGSGNDTMTGGSLQDFLAGGGGNDNLTGGGGNDQLTGSSGADNIQGNDGDDFLQAQNNDKDTVNGGTNSDASADFDLANVDGLDVGGVGAGLAPIIIPPKGSDLDPTYGTGGKTVIDSLGWSSISASTVDAQGRVYFAGYAYGDNGSGYGYDWAVARLTDTGALDTTYGTGGQTRIDFTDFDDVGGGYNSTDFADNIIIGPDGKAIVVGIHLDATYYNGKMAVARLLPDGSLDTLANDPTGAFNGTYGKQIFDIDGLASGERAYDAAVQADGKIVLVGLASTGQGGGDFAVVRLNADGSPDGNFNDGAAYNTVDIDDSYDSATAVALQTIDGEQKIVVGGNADSLWGIARFNANGSIDNSFGGGDTGTRTESFGGSSNYLSDIAVNSLGQIVAVGNTSDFSSAVTEGLPPSVSPNQQDAILAVYSPNAVGAPSFVDQPPEIGDYASFNVVAIDSQNRIVVAGENDNDFIVGRYLANLNVDTSFHNGLVRIDFSPSLSEFNTVDYPLGLGILSNKKIIVSGVSIPGYESFANYAAVKFMGDVATTPPNNEADVAEVEGTINYGGIHENPPAEPWASILNRLSPSAKLYVLSQPDDNGIVRIQLDNKSNCVDIYNKVAGDGKNNVVVNVDGVNMYYDALTTKRIEIYGNGGNDCIVTTGHILIPLVIDGGAGNDGIRGGDKNDLLFGGSGIDIIDGNLGADVVSGGADCDALGGGDGNDILIGGTSADAMLGGSGDDILIAGTTSYDTNIAALNALIAEWSSANTNAIRVAHIKGTLGGGLNGANFLKVGAGATVFNDGVVDLLTNDSGREWFFYRNTGNSLQKDQILGGTSGEEISLV